MMVQESAQATNLLVETSFLFPTAPAVQDASIAPPPAQSSPAPVESKPASSGLRTQSIVALLTGAITLVGGLSGWGVKHYYEQR